MTGGLDQEPAIGAEDSEGQDLASLRGLCEGPAGLEKPLSRAEDGGTGAGMEA